MGTGALLAARRRFAFVFRIDFSNERFSLSILWHVDSVLTQVAQIATAADYEQKRLMATKAMHHKVINKDGPNLCINVNIWWEWNRGERE